MKRGTVREDGLVFYRMAKGKPRWVTPEKYKTECDKVTAYRKKCIAMYKKLGKEKRKFGEYDSKRNLYFIGISTSGKEIWQPKAVLDRKRQLLSKGKKKYYEKCRALPNLHAKIGDKHPDNPDLYVIYKLGNRLTYGSYEKLQDVKEKKRITVLKKDLRYKKRRDYLLYGRERIKKGTKREDGLLFWHYDKKGDESWITQEVYNLRNEKQRQRKKAYRQRKRERMRSANTTEETNIG